MLVDRSRSASRLSRFALLVMIASAASALDVAVASAAGANYYVAPTGVSTNDGSQTRPLDLATALSASSPARSGDTIWVRGGVYRGNFTSLLNGAPGLPVIVRAYPGERATIDAVNAPTSAALTVKGSYAWFWGLEITNSSLNRTSGASSRGPGVAQFGANTKLINLVVHDNLDGIETWSGVTDGEVYGSVIYNNGAADGNGIGAGHSMYVQNSAGTKHLVDNVMSNSYNFGIHVYTEGGTIDNVDMQGNIAFNHGVLAPSSSYKANYFVGGSKVAQNPTVIGNFGYYPFGSQGRNGDFGWGTACNGLNMQNNYLAGGTSVKVNCSSATITGNVLYGAVASNLPSSFPSNLYSASKPGGVYTVVRPNQYESGRANLAIFNWARQSSVAVDLSGIGLASGDRFEIRDAQNFYGPPAVVGTYTGTAITVPMVGLTAAIPIGTNIAAPPSGPEFNAFVVLRTTGGSTAAPTATLSVAPSSITAGQSATLTWKSANASALTITPSVGVVSPNGSATVTPGQTTTYTLTASGSGGTVVASTTVTVGPPAGTSGGATFVKRDSTSKGAWRSGYGADGFGIAGDQARYPSFAQVTTPNAAVWKWAASTSDLRALQNAAGSDRLAAAWYGASFSMDVSLTDGAAHQIALYLLDWDNAGRVETVQVVDRATGFVLDERSVSAFQSGAYLVWKLTGNVRIVVRGTQGPNAVVSGVFFGGSGAGGATPATGAATFVALDATSRGNWASYGSGGSSIAGDVARLPAYAQVSFSGAAGWLWASSTTDSRAVLKSAGGDRLAGCWYDTSGSYTIDIVLTDAATHRVAFYLLDWDSQSRAESIEITDLTTGAVLDRRTASGFQNGVYLVWDLRGGVRVRVTRTQGPNAVVSGLFFN